MSAPCPAQEARWSGAQRRKQHDKQNKLTVGSLEETPSQASWLAALPHVLMARRHHGPVQGHLPMSINAGWTASPDNAICKSPTCCLLGTWRGAVKAVLSGPSIRVAPAPVSLLPLTASAAQAYVSK